MSTIKVTVRFEGTRRITTTKWERDEDMPENIRRDRDLCLRRQELSRDPLCRFLMGLPPLPREPMTAAA